MSCSAYISGAAGGDPYRARLAELGSGTMLQVGWAGSRRAGVRSRGDKLLSASRHAQCSGRMQQQHARNMGVGSQHPTRKSHAHAALLLCQWLFAPHAVRLLTCWLSLAAVLLSLHR